MTVTNWPDCLRPCVRARARRAGQRCLKHEQDKVVERERSAACGIINNQQESADLQSNRSSGKSSYGTDWPARGLTPAIRGAPA